jgi:hypothetical protein
MRWQLCWSRKELCHERSFGNRGDPASPGWCGATCRSGKAYSTPPAHGAPAFLRVLYLRGLRGGAGGERGCLRGDAESYPPPAGVSASSRDPEPWICYYSASDTGGTRFWRSFRGACACRASTGAAHSHQPGTRPLPIRPGHTPIGAGRSPAAGRRPQPAPCTNRNRGPVTPQFANQSGFSKRICPGGR